MFKVTDKQLVTAIGLLAVVLYFLKPRDKQ